MSFTRAHKKSAENQNRHFSKDSREIPGITEMPEDPQFILTISTSGKKRRRNEKPWIWYDETAGFFRPNRF